MVSLADRGSKGESMREVMKGHIKKGDIERGSITPSDLAAVKALLGKLKYE